MTVRTLARSALYVLLALLTLVVLAVAGAVALLHSEQGTRWLFARAVELAPGELAAARVDGRLTGPLTLEGLAYRDGDLALEIDRLHLDWRPGELLRGRFHLVDLAVAGTRVTLPDAAKEEPAPSGEPFTGLRLPLAVQVDNLELTDLQVVPAEGEAAGVERLALKLEAAGDRVSRLVFEGRAFDTEVAVDGGLTLSAALPMALAFEWRRQGPGEPELAGRGRLDGDLAALELTHQAAPPVGSELRARLFDLAGDPRWEATLALAGVSLGAFTDAFPATLDGELAGDGVLDRARLQGRLALSEPSTGPLAAEFEAGIGDGVARLERLVLTGQEGLRVEGSASYPLEAPGAALQAELAWTALRWPLVGEAVQFSSREGRLAVDGVPSAYRYSLALAGLVPGAPPFDAQAAGTGDLERAVLDSLVVTLEEGRVDGSGWAAWAPEPAWELKLAATGLPPALIQPELSGRLNLDLETKGRVAAGVPKASVLLSRLDGEFLEHPLQGRGRVDLDGGTLEIEGLELDSGDNRARVNGRVGERLDLAWSVAAPRLDALWPGLAGALDAKGRLEGSAERPRLKADLAGSGLGFQAHRVERLEGRADLGLGEGERLDLDLAADGLLLAGTAWESLSLKLAGTRTRHRAELALLGDEKRQARVALAAGLDPTNAWRGRLERLVLAQSQAGEWRLAGPALFRVVPGDRSGVERFCLVSGPARACGSFDLAADGAWRGSLEGSDVPLALAGPWLPPDTRLDGSLRLKAGFEGDAGGGVRGRADLNIPSGALDFELEETAQKLDFSGGKARALIDAEGLSANLDLPLAGLGGVEGRLRLPGFRVEAPDFERQPLEGRVDARVEDLTLVSLLAPDIRNVKGRIEAGFDLSGRLGEPRLKGGAEVREAAIDIPYLGLELREIDLRLAAPDVRRVTLEGGVASGGGRLEVSGEALLDAERDFPAELRLKGEEWLAMNTAEAEVRVSPDLAVRRTPGRTDIEGEVVVPFARIRPRRIPESSVSSSPDMVIVGGDRPAAERREPRLHARVRVVLGDRVNFEGFGLRADLSGDLLVIDEPNQPVRGRGRIGVTEGTYRGYGQDLKIERGYALFADSPVDNPGIDVRAIREAGDVTAGLRVTGTLKEPTLEVFSTPAMSEADALSYLLTGRAMGEGGGGQGVGVAAALQASGIGSATAEVGRQLGLDELRVETAGDLAEASVVAGTWLSPRLYVQYVNELGTGETLLRLRHDLTRRIQIQTETGRAQGVDIFYTFER